MVSVIADAIRLDLHLVEPQVRALGQVALYGRFDLGCRPGRFARASQP